MRSFLYLFLNVFLICYPSKFAYQLHMLLPGHLLEQEVVLLAQPYLGPEPIFVRLETNSVIIIGFVEYDITIGGIVNVC